MYATSNAASARFQWVQIGGNIPPSRAEFPFAGCTSRPRAFSVRRRYHRGAQVTLKRFNCSVEGQEGTRLLFWGIQQQGSIGRMRVIPALW